MQLVLDAQAWFASRIRLECEEHDVPLIDCRLGSSAAPTPSTHDVGTYQDELDRGARAPLPDWETATLPERGDARMIVKTLSQTSLI